ncbi:hypothetical protein [Dermatophilus congolensis]|uniref:Uncharacterized protein n=1 Tax=Dermatophilus congolensis TaxID=1863 RepID=A0A239VGH5_9MICO|nr:hypothetical protein [Dermatophilus congolensis]MBO3128939.1 hypothetical protein [Dermatophilus congolensis]MBO3132423.1 hypothetical protein [Dermatophilus congolensis]MBO3133416.1 hypothetical protein [Dermatophilus congolensis]MBO3135651.1 hypothetical protein [Dermatophilus congolensis]MBO3137890.1 hypothetical protein [Dermatophilus congolensis]
MFETTAQFVGASSGPCAADFGKSRLVNSAAFGLICDVAGVMMLSLEMLSAVVRVVQMNPRVGEISNAKGAH